MPMSYGVSELGQYLGDCSCSILAKIETQRKETHRKEDIKGTAVQCLSWWTEVLTMTHCVSGPVSLSWSFR